MDSCLAASSFCYFVPFNQREVDHQSVSSKKQKTVQNTLVRVLQVRLMFSRSALQASRRSWPYNKSFLCSVLKKGEAKEIVWLHSLAHAGNEATNRDEMKTRREEVDWALTNICPWHIPPPLALYFCSAPVIFLVLLLSISVSSSFLLSSSLCSWQIPEGSCRVTGVSLLCANGRPQAETLHIFTATSSGGDNDSSTLLTFSQFILSQMN